MFSGSRANSRLSVFIELYVSATIFSTSEFDLTGGRRQSWKTNPGSDTYLSQIDSIFQVIIEIRQSRVDSSPGRNSDHKYPSPVSRRCC